MIIFIEIDKDTTASSWTSYIMASALWYPMTQRVTERAEHREDLDMIVLFSST